MPCMTLKDPDKTTRTFQRTERNNAPYLVYVQQTVPTERYDACRVFPLLCGLMTTVQRHLEHRSGRSVKREEPLKTLSKPGRLSERGVRHSYEWMTFLNDLELQTVF